jgi:2,4-dienoyl-CoA reductase-like NADH-dependent reductase (Old Yellow Enzyme family)
VAGRVSTPQAAEEILAEGRADFVSLARALHADPDWPNRAFAGRRYRPCIGCPRSPSTTGSSIGTRITSPHRAATS